jgi:hypothetical protein
MLAALSATGGVAGPLQALGAHAGALSLLRHLPSFSQSRGASSNGRHSSVYITDVDNNPTSHMPLLLGLVNYFERHMPYGKPQQPSSRSWPCARSAQALQSQPTASRTRRVYLQPSPWLDLSTQKPSAPFGQQQALLVLIRPMHMCNVGGHQNPSKQLTAPPMRAC